MTLIFTIALRLSALFSTALSGAGIPQEFLDAKDCSTLKIHKRGEDFMACEAPEVGAFEASVSHVYGTPKSGDVAIPTEAEVARLGHMGGIKPLHYDLLFTYKPDKPFAAETTLTFVAVEESSRILLHVASVELALDASSVELVELCGRSVVCVDKVAQEAEEEIAVLTLAETLRKGVKYELRLKSSATGVDRPMYGLEESSSAWKGAAWALHTVFMHRNARTAFPCLDHPRLKATFALTIRHPQDTEAHSAMPKAFEDKKLEDGSLESVFEKTPPMSTYVMSFALTRNLRKVPVPGLPGDSNLILPPTVTEKQVGMLLNMTQMSFEYLQTYFATPYPLPKYDTLVVNPFQAGRAVENFGLTTMGEEAFVRGLSNSKDPEITYYELFGLVAHEVFHSWLGNLVTIDSWETLAQQEALTNYFTYFVLDRLGVKSQRERFLLDSRRTSIAAVYGRPSRNYAFLERPINTAFDLRQETNHMWQTLQIYMMTPLIFYHLDEVTRAGGEDVFVGAMRKLIEDKAYGSVSFDDFLAAVASAAGREEPADFLRLWMREPGMPMWRIAESSSELRLRQESIGGNFSVPVGDAKAKPLLLSVEGELTALRKARETLPNTKAARAALQQARLVLPMRMIYDEPESYTALLGDYKTKTKALGDAAAQEQRLALFEATLDPVLRDLLWAFAYGLLPPRDAKEDRALAWQTLVKTIVEDFEKDIQMLIWSQWKMLLCSYNKAVTGKSSSASFKCPSERFLFRNFDTSPFKTVMSSA